MTCPNRTHKAISRRLTEPSELTATISDAFAGTCDDQLNCTGITVNAIAPSARTQALRTRSAVVGAEVVIKARPHA